MKTADNLTEQPEARLAQLLSHISVARLEAEVLLAHVLQVPRSALSAHPEQRIDAATAARYQALLGRRAAGEPVAYILGEREFWSLPLTVSPAVLIPRPETELVVERTLALLEPAHGVSAAHGAHAAHRRVADLGTGSGAVALALASERPGWQVLATDLSAAALRVARGNAERLGLQRVEFIAGDWLAPLAGRRFHAIVSNPPYVAADDAAMTTLRHEPAAALTPGPTGLEALRHLIASAAAHLEPHAWLVLEHGAQQAAPVAAALVAAGYARVRCHRDLAGHERVTEAQWQ
jgi:release factor glutamine methyltransferase